MARETRSSLDLQAPLLLDGSPGSVGQIPISQGASDPAIWGDAGTYVHYYQDAAPGSPLVGQEWTKTDDPKLPTYRYVNDGTSSQWVQLVSSATSTQVGLPTFIQATAPAGAELGGYTSYAWWDTAGGNLTLWIEDGV